MTPAQARLEIRECRRRLQTLDDTAATLTAHITEAGRDRFEPHIGRQAHQQLSEVELRRREMQERIAALTDALPPRSAVVAAQKQLVVLNGQAASAVAEFEQASQACLQALITVEGTARRLAAVRAAARDAIFAAVDIITGDGRDVGLRETSPLCRRGMARRRWRAIPLGRPDDRGLETAITDPLRVHTSPQLAFRSRGRV
jgi:hypothetical protein